MKKFTISLIALLILSFGIFSCSKSSSSASKGIDGSKASIENYLTKDAYNKLDSIDFPIHIGNTPPNIEGTYTVAPNKVEWSDVPGDYIGMPRDDAKLFFNNFNLKDLTIDYDMIESSTNTDGSGSVISGSGNNFTVYLKSEVKKTSGEKATGASIITGEWTSTGIKNFKICVIMINNNGHNTVFIPNKSSRVIVDSDKFSEKI